MPCANNAIVRRLINYLNAEYAEYADLVGRTLLMYQERQFIKMKTGPNFSFEISLSIP